MTKAARSKPEVRVENFAGTQEIEEVLLGLDLLAGEHPELAQACAYYGRLLPLLARAQVGVPPLDMDPGRVREKVERGEPVLRGEELPLSSPQLVSLFSEIWGAAAGEGEAGGPGPSMEPETLAAWIDEVMGGEFNWAQKTAPIPGMDGSRLRAILQNCLKPYLHAWREALMPGVDTSGWQKGICPFCGSLPLLAELRGPQRARSLRCGLCGADWRFNRLQCAHCGCTDTRSLAILAPEGELQRASIQACSECRAYLKMVITVDPIPARFLPVEDLATLSLDLIAGNFGYTRPGW